MIKTTIAMMMLTTPAFADFTKTKEFQFTQACVWGSFLGNYAASAGMSRDEFFAALNPRNREKVLSISKTVAEFIWISKPAGISKQELSDQMNDYESKFAIDRCWDASDLLKDK